MRLALLLLVACGSKPPQPTGEADLNAKTDPCTRRKPFVGGERCEKPQSHGAYLSPDHDTKQAVADLQMALQAPTCADVETLRTRIAAVEAAPFTACTTWGADDAALRTAFADLERTCRSSAPADFGALRAPVHGLFTCLQPPP